MKRLKKQLILVSEYAKEEISKLVWFLHIGIVIVVDHPFRVEFGSSTLSREGHAYSQ